MTDKEQKPVDPKVTSLKSLMAESLESERDLRLREILTANITPSLTEGLISNDYLEAARRAIQSSQNQISSLGDFAKVFASKEELSNEISSLRKRISEATSALEKARHKDGKSEEKVSALEALVAELKVKEDLGFLLTRVNTNAQQKLIDDVSFRNIFAEDEDCSAFVMSVDIRRSTELMLKARSPSLFAEFISRLTRELYGCVVRNNGVFDKFTGDGILAFFPEKFSGNDYGYSVVKAADECHKVFERIYRESRSSFTSVLNGIGLGIGIDFGTVRLLRVAEGLTVVGVPVVYACRLSGAPPRQTLLNQPAYELISHNYGQKLVIEETSLTIKHEGEIVTYAVSVGHEEFVPRPPDWESYNGSA